MTVSPRVSPQRSRPGPSRGHFGLQGQRLPATQFRQGATPEGGLVRVWRHFIRIPRKRFSCRSWPLRMQSDSVDRAIPFRISFISSALGQAVPPGSEVPARLPARPSWEEVSICPAGSAGR